MKTWLGALGTCPAAGGLVGGWPPPNSGASPDTPCPHTILLLASRMRRPTSGAQLKACRPPRDSGAIEPKPHGANGRLSADISAKCTSAFGVRRDKAALFQWVKVPPGEQLQPEATGATVR